jgi:hypothetical protein
MSTTTDDLKVFFNAVKDTIDHAEKYLSEGRVQLARDQVRSFRERWKTALWDGVSLPPGD